MILKEFFSKPLEVSPDKKKDETKEIKQDELFWFIIDHDQLHKDFFFDIARKVKKLDGVTPEKVLELYMPMVNKGCKEYYAKNKLTGKLGKLFPKALREELCHRLHDHYFDDVKHDRYNIGN